MERQAAGPHTAGRPCRRLLPPESGSGIEAPIGALGKRSPRRGARDTWQDRGLLHDYFAEPEDTPEGTERRSARGFGAFFQSAGLAEPMLRPTAASEGGVLPLPPLTPDVTRSPAESAGSKPRGRSRSIS